MNEHIKTGKEIAKKVSYGYECDKNDKWVFWSWLKDIEKHNPLLTIEDVLSLLEEKQ